jgi:hypothetical protein
MQLLSQVVFLEPIVLVGAGLESERARASHVVATDDNESDGRYLSPDLVSH